jgi:PIN domain nuclease of toxin-antitoxin system
MDQSFFEPLTVDELKVLLDTHVLLWTALEPQLLSPRQLDILEDSDNLLFVNAATEFLEQLLSTMRGD